MSQLFIVDQNKARPAKATTLPDARLHERKHLQEWVIANPTILGKDVLVVTSEYANWAAESGGAPAYDRLDVLGMDSLGRLIVVELKRDVATRDIHLQAITYAALVSRFTLKTLAHAHAAFLRREEGTKAITEEEARARLLNHVGGDLDADLLKRPRQVLIASTFPKQVTSSVVWLSEMGLDISLIQVSVWRVGEQLVADFSTVYPTPEVQEFTLAPRREEADKVSKRIEQRNRSKNFVQLLVESEFMPAETVLRIVPHGTTAEIRQELEAWLDEDRTRRVAIWTGEAPKAIRWQGDDYTPTGVANAVFSQAVGATGAIQGPAWFVLTDPTCPENADPEQWAGFQGKTLVEIVRALGLDSATGRRAPIIDRLLAADEPAEGQPLTIVVPPIKQDVEGIRTWLAEDPTRAAAKWHQDPHTQVVWAYDGQAWDMKDLASEILRQSLGVDTDKVWGPNWFRLADGRTLSNVADSLQ